MLKKIMMRAHEIAKTLEGDYVARMSLALSQAWAEARKPAKATLTTSSGSRKHKSWVAEIVGSHPRFGFDRRFVDPVVEGWLEKVYELADGIYEVCNAGERSFIRVAGGAIETVSKAAVLETVA